MLFWFLNRGVLDLDGVSFRVKTTQKIFLCRVHILCRTTRHYGSSSSSRGGRWALYRWQNKSTAAIFSYNTPSFW